MIPERLVKIIELLIAKNKDRKAIWNKTSGNNQFKLSANDGSAITIAYSENNYNNEDSYEIIIFNNNGDAIERYSTDYQGTTSEDYNLFNNLYKSVTDSYYKVDETMDTLLKSLSSQDVIGNNEEEEKLNNIALPPEDDDLPF